MKYSLQHFTGAVCLSFWIGFQPGLNAQSIALAEVPLHPRTQETQVQTQSLIGALKNLEQRYDVTFTYMSDLLQGKQVAVGEYTGEDLEQALGELLRNTDLSFHKVNKHYYAITPKPLPRKEQSELVPPLPRLHARSSPQLAQLRPQSVMQVITGKVVDETGEGIPGVNILEKGTSNGTITDIEGQFSLNVGDGATLVISAVGYLSKEVPVGNQTSLSIQLEDDVKALDEVVVVGYGTERRKDLTGSVASIGAESFNTGVVVAPEQLMQGKVAGVNIVQNSGQPGAASTVRIRGENSISAGNDPLYVIDGVPLQFGSDNMFVSSTQGSSPFASQATNPLNTLNPADIESIDVLKDASATAIYGSRGANGVIVITTKSKKANETITYDAFVGMSAVRKTLPVLSASEYRAYAESNGLQYPDEGANTDWQDEIFRTAISQNHNIAFGGGTTTSNYRASVGYTSQEGVILSSGLEKYTGRLNASHKAFDGKLRIGTNLTYGRINEDNTPISSNINNEGGNILKDAIRWAPTLPVYNADGSYYQLGELRINPVSWVDVDDERYTGFFLGSGDVAFDIIDGLTFKLNGGYSDASTDRYTNLPATHPSGQSQNGRVTIAKGRNYSTLFESTLTYNKELGSNTSLTLLGGYSFQRFVSEGTFSEANNFVSSFVKWNLMQSGETRANTSFKEANRLESVFGRLNLRLLDRYLFTATLRNDGSSRFGENYRRGWFPSGAFAWRISDEPFFQSAVVSNLKLRTGYGITGNQEIPNNLYRQQLSISGSAVYVLGGQAIPSVLPTNFANPNLRWESTSQLNVGIDLGFLNERFSATIDYYRKHTSDLLLAFSTIAPSVVETQWANVGEVQNQGIEVALNATLVQSKDFTWSANVNFSRNRNEVLSLSNDEFTRTEIRNAPVSGVVSNGARTQIIRPGLPLGTFYGRQFTGFDESGMETYLDADGDGQADEVVIGSAQPDFIYGISSSARWKNFDASITFRGVVGNDILNNTAAEFGYTNGAPGINILRSALDSPVSRDQIPQFSSRWLEDGSYLRLDNLNIGYTLNTTSIPFLKNARFYVTGQNLFVITGYTGYDPEVRANTNQGGAAPMGIDYLAYPRPRTFQLGGSFSF
ncbi:iron complex outermembrane recepter protein [Catalinimonas alkaloidigena]|uniref:Iron complex outermembrane recepter protein n=1 Tax=Catalinimonas alkaloidigena TaxID=1075417 RepID=A0A1G8XIL6_9BACT|nr:SusC/RagA family TonB-linked outer membrane protein [Catalinimonas alkaloidigena]SDJ90442.1 iron complex outermembrane recepter protein [Catalinimonas alkaloidigena]